MMSNKVPVYDTLFVDRGDFNSIKNFIENKKVIRTDVKGIPEVYLKTKRGTVFLTQFNPLAVDIDGSPLAISMDMAYRIRRKKFLGIHFLGSIVFPKITTIIMISITKSLRTMATN